ncbi:MAG: hypothetical protein ISP92_09560 [Pseudomonadales bacterium]|jgi:hypothetical protein|nr:hypothetical protein [Pseudomonadales bacterium]MDA0760577.1 SxtJ family membrane protein [Pseudomonadota bacterium]MDA0957669.1 SxtJ family membrane protein [Pseudomonadota bacterium]
MNQPLPLPSNLRFGSFFAVITLLACSYAYFEGLKLLSQFLGVAAVILILVTWIAPARLAVLNRLWMKFGVLLGSIIGPLILGTIFLLLFTPLAMVFRLIGRDELNLKMTSRSTHWHSRDKQALSNEPFKVQF